VDDALRLGCAAIGFTIYPGSSEALDMFEEISELREEAAAKGVPTVIWSYPRGEDLSKAGETAIDVGAYAAQIAALLGAHIIKIKLSTDHLEQGEAKKVYEKQGIDVASPAARVRHCMQAAFAGRRIVVFSGGAAKGTDAVYDDARAIRDGGGNGSIIGRNTFQRSREDAMAMLDKLVEIYKGRD
jgi:fructose-bisphosphate aldolase, class I